MKRKGIIPGYHGIMDLDTTNMEQKHVKQAIDQHYKDIKIYKEEQAQLKPEHRYENTVIRIQKQHEYISMKEKAYYDAIEKSSLERSVERNQSKHKC